MIQTDVLAGGIRLPERRLHERILCLIPRLEIVAQQSAGIAGVRIQAPERVVDVIFNHVVTEQLHPVLVLAVIHVTAPLTDEQRRNVLLVDICPGIAPVIVQQRLRGEVLVEPCLVVDGRTVVMRRIYDLGVHLRITEIYRMLLDAAEIAAPPCTDIRRIVASVGDTPHIARHRTAHGLLHTLDEDQRIRIDLEDGFRALGRRILPVVLVSGAVPLGSLVTLLTLAVRLILEVVAEHRIIVRIALCEPCQGLDPHIRGNHAGCLRLQTVPEVVVVTGVVGVRAVNVDEALQTVLLALCQQNVEDLLAVLQGLAVLLEKFEVEAVGFIAPCLNGIDLVGLALHPGNHELRGNGETDDIDAVVGNCGQERIRLLRIETVRGILGAVQTEPVGAREPYLIAVLVVELAAYGMEPVVIAVVGSGDCHCRCQSGSRHGCSQCQCRGTCRESFEKPHSVFLLFEIVFGTIGCQFHCTIISRKCQEFRKKFTDWYCRSVMHILPCRIGSSRNASPLDIRRKI